MMEVFVVVTYWNCDGEEDTTIEGVFDTEEKAEHLVAELQSDHDVYEAEYYNHCVKSYSVQ